MRTADQHLQKLNAVMFELPVVVKASTDGGKRMVELQVSSEDVDLEGDVILQSALLNSADSFVKNGHLDIDHYSELGHRMTPPIANPASYIVGRPVAVKDMGHGRTAVVGQISASTDGSIDTEHNQYDMLWKSLTSEPPVKWRASIYGFPLADGVEDCSETRCSHGATRFLVKGLDWRSLAFTRNPVNNSITGFARVITAKSFIHELKKASSPDVTKSSPFPQDQLFASIGDSGSAPTLSAMNCPENLDEMWGEYLRHMLRDCSCRDPLIGNSLPFFRDHYMVCRGLPFDKADILAHALMHMVHKERKRKE